MKNYFIILLLLPWLVIFTFGCATHPNLIEPLKRAIQQNNAADLQDHCAKGAAGACALIGQKVSLNSRLSILQGASHSKGVQLAILLMKPQQALYVVKDSEGRPPNFLRIGIPKRQSWPGQKSVVDQVTYNDLNSTKSYELLVIGEQGELLDQRSFRTLDTSKSKARLAVASCMHDHLKDVQLQIWPELLSQKPDAIFLIGDNVYADWVPPSTWRTADPTQLWKRYTQTRSELALFKTPDLIPIFALWDDHDYGMNDGDSSYAHKQAAKQIFQAFFPSEQIENIYTKGPGVASHLRAFHQDFYFLDGRSFRTPNGERHPNQTHWGVPQEKWLLQNLQQVQGRLAWLISGDQIFGGYHPYESYQGSHPQSFEKMMPQLKNLKRRRLIFLTGDRHLTEIIKVPEKHLGYSTYELTSSGIHARVFADAFDRHPDPHMLTGKAGVHNYMIVDLDPLRKKNQLKVTSFGLNKQVIFSKELKIQN